MSIKLKFQAAMSTVGHSKGVIIPKALAQTLQEKKQYCFIIEEVTQSAD